VDKFLVEAAGFAPQVFASPTPPCPQKALFLTMIGNITETTSGGPFRREKERQLLDLAGLKTGSLSPETHLLLLLLLSFHPKRLLLLLSSLPPLFLELLLAPS
jgi:hypothetical protein